MPDMLSSRLVSRPLQAASKRAMTGCIRSSTVVEKEQFTFLYSCSPYRISVCFPCWLLHLQRPRDTRCELGADPPSAWASLDQGLPWLWQQFEIQRDSGTTCGWMG